MRGTAACAARRRRGPRTPADRIRDRPDDRRTGECLQWRSWPRLPDATPAPGAPLGIDQVPERYERTGRQPGGVESSALPALAEVSPRAVQHEMDPADACADFG